MPVVDLAILLPDRKPQSVEFAALIQTLYAQKFTGSVILNFSQGVPLAVDIPSVQIRLERVGSK